MNCKKCENLVQEDLKFCGNCGEKVYLNEKENRDINSIIEKGQEDINKYPIHTLNFWKSYLKYLFKSSIIIGIIAVLPIAIFFIFDVSTKIFAIYGIIFLWFMIVQPIRKMIKTNTFFREGLSKKERRSATIWIIVLSTPILLIFIGAFIAAF